MLPLKPISQSGANRPRRLRARTIPSRGRHPVRDPVQHPLGRLRVRRGRALAGLRARSVLNTIWPSGRRHAGIPLRNQEPTPEIEDRHRRRRLAVRSTAAWAAAEMAGCCCKEMMAKQARLPLRRRRNSNGRPSLRRDASHQQRDPRRDQGDAAGVPEEANEDELLREDEGGDGGDPQKVHHSADEEQDHQRPAAADAIGP